MLITSWAEKVTGAKDPRAMVRSFRAAGFPEDIYRNVGGDGGVCEGGKANPPLSLV